MCLMIGNVSVSLEHTSTTTTLTGSQFQARIGNSSINLKNLESQLSDGSELCLLW